MTNAYLQSGEPRAELVEKLFSKIARRYDLLNDVMTFRRHRAWKRELVGMSGFESGKRALDLCCGTGDLAFVMASRAIYRIDPRAYAGKHETADGRIRLPNASIVGLDFTEPMLRLASARVRTLQAARHEPGITFVRGDALRLPFPDRTFDVVTVGYGLRNLADLRHGLTEIHRALKPGGIFLSLDMGKPPNPLWRAMVFGYLRLLLPTLGWLFFREPDTHKYLLDSLAVYPAQEGVKKAMDEIGFAETGYQNFLGGISALNYGKKK